MTLLLATPESVSFVRNVYFGRNAWNHQVCSVLTHDCGFDRQIFAVMSLQYTDNVEGLEIRRTDGATVPLTAA